MMPALNSVTTPVAGNPPDPAAITFREPQVAVGAGRDADRLEPAVMPALNSGTVPAGVIRPIRSPWIP